MSDVTPEVKAQLAGALSEDSAHAELDVVTELAITIRAVALDLLAPAMVREDQLLRQIGEFLARLKGLIVLADGIPDWNGNSRAYRLVERLVADAVYSHSAGSIEHPAARNRVHKSATRAVPMAMLNLVLSELDITLADDEKNSLLKGKRTAEDKQIVREVNRHRNSRRMPKL